MLFPHIRNGLEYVYVVLVLLSTIYNLAAGGPGLGFLTSAG